MIEIRYVQTEDKEFWYSLDRHLPEPEFENKVSNKRGYIQSINAKEIGKIVCDLGAGRIRKEDKIDNSVGIILNKKVSDKVEKKEILATVYANSKEKMEKAKEKLLDVIKIEEKEIKKQKMIIEIVK